MTRFKFKITDDGFILSHVLGGYHDSVDVMLELHMGEAVSSELTSSKLKREREMKYALANAYDDMVKPEHSAILDTKQGVEYARTSDGITATGRTASGLPVVSKVAFIVSGNGHDKRKVELDRIKTSSWKDHEEREKEILLKWWNRAIGEEL